MISPFSGEHCMSTTVRTYHLDASRRERLAIELAACLTREFASVVFAYLYGSVLDRDMVHDVDIGIFLPEPLSNDSHVQASAIAARLRAVVELPMDVRVLNGAPTSFLFHVFRGRLLLSRDEALLTALLEDVGRRYLDIELLLRRSTKDAFAA
jgi:predicted nucleotidyltransferase